MRPLLVKFTPPNSHPSPQGPELPYIYAPEHDRIFIGPVNSFHNDLIYHTPELRESYNYDGSAPFLNAPKDHVHGRILWNQKTLTAYGQKDPALVAQIAAALKVNPPAPQERNVRWTSEEDHRTAFARIWNKR